MNYIELGNHKIEVCISKDGIRMINPGDVKKFLELEDEQLGNYFVDAKIITDILFEKVYITKNATKEQEIIFKGLCLVGIYSLIDEVCKIDFRNISYIQEFNNNLALENK